MRPTPGTERASRSIPSTRPAGGPRGSSRQPGQRHGAAVRPALAPGSPPRRGRVTSRDPRTSQRRSLLAELQSDVPPERSGAVVVALDEGMPAPDEARRTDWRSLPFVVVGVTGGVVDDGWLQLCDVIVEEGDRRSTASRRTWRSTPSRPPRWRSCSGGSSASRWPGPGGRVVRLLRAAVRARVRGLAGRTPAPGRHRRRSPGAGGS